MEFDKLVKKRASIRKYSDKKPRIEEVINCIDIANLAPSPGNLPILKFIIIEDKNKINEIAQACQQEFIKKVPILVIVCSELKEVNIMYDKRAIKYIKQHAGASIENFLLNITNLGLASCWIGAYTDSEIKDLLKIAENVEIEAILPVGYSMKGDSTIQRKKTNIDNRIFFETWKNKFRKPFPKMSD
jgi:nitroreductase